MSEPISTQLHVTYDRSGLRPRVLHVGFGAFAKAHVMVFHDELLRNESSDWGAVVTRLHSGEGELTLLDQADHLFTVGEMSNDDLMLREIGAVVKTLHPKRDGFSALLAQIADPDLSVITLTITEKGYCLSGGHLDMNNPAVVRDLREADDAETAIGILAKGLRLRQVAGLGGITILSCDNLPANGTLCRQAVLEFAEQLDPDLSRWIEAECRFPCSMVDRITPAMTEASQQKLEAALGHPDPNGVLCEPFRQWVIEDSFAGDRPAWDLAGAQFVADVAPFEDMKLRLLNGSHSFLAYLGALAGKETISDCMADPVFLTAAKRLMLDEQAPTLDLPDGIDVSRYSDALIERFSNTALRHKTTQIASDGSQKLPQRLLAPIRQHLQSGTEWPLAALAVAGWMRYCRGRSEIGGHLPINDPLSGKFEAFATRSDGADYVNNLLSLAVVFGTDLPASRDFVSRIQTAYEALGVNGAAKSIAAALQ
ncbi:mannitol dehydrogenase family protein [Roseibium sp. MMSF_3544]|uniref:mannitol dehydrogenase family protein n=1 Tax=unclassified Roseibium TaxID=2629323 RepID=UPI00273F88B1|nr:fructuronate reductase [Roseibium sp. MMSF_3544]